MTRIVAFLRSVLGVAGLAALVALVWYGLPLLGNETLAASEIRGAIIFAVGLFYMLSALLRARRATHRAEALERTLTEEDAHGEDYEAQAERIAGAITLLKARRGASSLYALPWYLLIGPPGVGKTTALIHSGLAFPANAPGSVSGVGGTRNCDVWFSEDAVMIDTAGRYTTHETDEMGDQRDWRTFLTELKRARRVQPINGVLLAFSCEEMLMGNDVSIAAHAAAVRARLSELHDTFGLKMPVYAIFTKADLVAGFREYFGKLTAEERKRVWGATFQTRNPDEDTFRHVPEEFGRLISALTDRIAERMAREKDTSSRHTLMRFPEQMEALAENVELFLRLIFQNANGSDAILRGFYFTSGTQQGTSFDHMLGAMMGHSEAEAGGLLSGRGRSYFLHDLLKNVVFPERGWVSHTRSAARARSWGRGLGLAATCGLVAISMGVLGVRYWESAGLVRATDVYAEVYREAQVELAEETLIESDDPRGLLPSLAIARELPGGYLGISQPRAQLAGIGNLGLSREDAIYQAGREAYSQALERGLRPRMMLRLERDLAKAVSAGDQARAFEALRVYLLTGKEQPGQGDDLAIQTYFARAWAPFFIGNDQGYRDVNVHLAAMLELDSRVTPVVPVSDALVAAAQDGLSGLGAADVVWLSLQGQGGALEPLRPFARTGAEAGLRLTNGRPMATVEVTPLLTVEGYDLVVAPAIEEAEDRLAAATWVLGRLLPAEESLRDDLRALYASEVLDIWEETFDLIEPAPGAGEALGPAAGAALTAATFAISDVGNALTTNANEEMVAWSRLLEDPARARSTEAALSRLGQAESFGEVDAALAALPDGDAPAPAILAGFVERLAQGIRAQLVRGELVGAVRTCQALVGDRYPFAESRAAPISLWALEALVSPSGELAELERAHLERRGLAGPLPRPLQETIDQSKVLHALFFADGQPEIPFEVSLAAASQSIQSVRFRAGDQAVSLTRESGPVPMGWPWDASEGIRIEAQSSARDTDVALTFDGGIWSIVPLLTEARDSRQAGGLIEVAHGVAGGTVVLQFNFGAAGIAFLAPELTDLRCPRLR